MLTTMYKIEDFFNKKKHRDKVTSKPGEQVSFGIFTGTERTKEEFGNNRCILHYLLSDGEVVWSIYYFRNKKEKKKIVTILKNIKKSKGYKITDTEKRLLSNFNKWKKSEKAENLNKSLEDNYKRIQTIIKSKKIISILST